MTPDQETRVLGLLSRASAQASEAIAIAQDEQAERLTAQRSLGAQRFIAIKWRRRALLALWIAVFHTIVYLIATALGQCGPFVFVRLFP